MSSLASISLQFHHVKCNVGQMNAFEHFGGLQLPPGASVICLFRKGRSHAFQTRYCSGFIPSSETQGQLEGAGKKLG